MSANCNTPDLDGSSHFLTFEISLYKDNGYEIPRMTIKITARLSVRTQRKLESRSEGKKPTMTCGIVSPTITQKAIMPPNALHPVSIRFEAE